MTRKMLIVAAAALVVLTAVLPTLAQGNLLNDPGFEGTYTNRGRADFNIPEAWGVWYAESPRTESWMNLQPVAFPHNGPDPNPYEGSRSMNFNKGYATFTAALYQQVPVPEGSPVTASAVAQVKTCNPAPNTPTCGSAVESGSFTRVGIDPNGGTNPNDSDIVWSNNAQPHDRWDTMTVSATATGPSVTIFLYTTQAWPAQINTAYWDAASLTIGGPGGSVPGQPSATLVPTAPPLASFVVRQPPQADGSIIHTVQPGDTMDAIAFAYGVSRQEILDLNGISNGRYLLVGQQLLISEAPDPSEQTQEASGLPTPDPSVGVAMAQTASAVQANATPTPATSPALLASLRIRSDGSVTWLVQEGQTAEQIAATNGISVDDLLAINGFSTEADILVGNEILIFPAPGGETAPLDTPVTAETTSEAPLVTEPSGLTPDTAAPAPLISITSVLPATDLTDATAQICVSMFDDQNVNRLQEISEPLLAEGAIMIMRGNDLVETYTTTAKDEPHCFTDLTDGEYFISAFSPEGFGLTTPTQLLVQPAPGWTITIAFGAAEGFEAPVAPLDIAEITPEATVASKAASKPANPLEDRLSYVAFGMAVVVLSVGSAITLVLRLR